MGVEPPCTRPGSANKKLSRRRPRSARIPNLSASETRCGKRRQKGRYGLRRHVAALDSTRAGEPTSGSAPTSGTDRATSSLTNASGSGAMVTDVLTSAPWHRAICWQDSKVASCGRNQQVSLGDPPIHRMPFHDLEVKALRVGRPGPEITSARVRPIGQGFRDSAGRSPVGRSWRDRGGPGGCDRWGGPFVEEDPIAGLPGRQGGCGSRRV